MRPNPSADGPDVLLDVPVLKVDQICLEVEALRAYVSLVAEVSDLVRLSVGADAHLRQVKLEIRGVEAVAQLRARLDHVAGIVERTLTTLDRNPEILQHVGTGVESAARGTGTVTGTAMAEFVKSGASAAEDAGEGKAVEGTAEEPRAADEGADGSTDGDADGDGDAFEREHHEIATLHDTFHETKESVRDLSRALRRKVTQSSSRG